jgi:cystathionine beta-lyase
MAPSKTFNVPGLGASFAIIQNPALRKQVEAAMAGIVPHVNILGVVAAEAAYAECDDWLQALRAYSDGEPRLCRALRRGAHAWRRHDQPRSDLPPLARSARDQAGRAAGGSPAERRETGGQRRQPGLAPAAKASSGMNFGCPRSTLVEGLERIRAAVARQQTNRLTGGRRRRKLLSTTQRCLWVKTQATGRCVAAHYVYNFKVYNFKIPANLSGT